MSETRQVWKPWRAKTRTAASRMMRRLSTAGRVAATSGSSWEGALGVHLARPAVGGGPAVGQRGQRPPDLGLAVEVELGDGERLRVGRLGQHDAPWVDDHRAPARAVARRVLPDLVRGDHEGLVLDRAGAEEDLPVLARGRERERGRDDEHAGAAHGEDPVELGEAQVVTDAQTELDAAGGLREDDLLAGRLVLGLPVGLAADLDVEHVDLAVNGLLLAVGAEVHGGVRAALGPLDALGDRARDQVDAQLARRRARPRERGPVERLGAGHRLLG